MNRQAQIDHLLHEADDIERENAAVEHAYPAEGEGLRPIQFDMPIWMRGLAKRIAAAGDA